MDNTQWNINPTLYPEQNQSSDQFMGHSRVVNPTYAHGTAGDRFVGQSRSSPVELEALHRLPVPFSTVSSAESSASTAISNPALLGVASALPTASNSNTGKRKQAPRSKAKGMPQWESYKEVMYEVYMKGDKTLGELIKFMKESYQFEAT